MIRLVADGQSIRSTVDEGLVGFRLECVGTMSMNVWFISVRMSQYKY